MCGIAGFIDHKKSKEALVSLTNILCHRGPDASGYYHAAESGVGLGHRRLSILDLTEAGSQPMYSHNGRFVMVYNGEVYNAAELAAQKLPGVSWRGHSDSEVILELYVKFGAASVAWLNGMFAFAIHDLDRKEVFICRDGIGIKPLFYHADGSGSIAFSSELKALRDLARSRPGSAPAIATEAIPYFLHLGYIPEPLTIYKNIFKFPAGHYAIVPDKGGAIQPAPFWRAEDYYLRQPQITEADALRQYRDVVYKAVEKQMISDVPLGTFLSGGIDSSLVTAVAAQVSGVGVKTFSIGFEEAAFDESKYAGQVAEHLKTEHHLLMVKMQDLLELVPQFIGVYDEPFADASAFPTMIVSRLARQHVTVTLSGDGGDELFQGYGMYNWAARLADPKLRFLRRPVVAASKLLNQRYQRAGQVFDYPSRAAIPSHIFSQEQYFFSQQELRRLLPVPQFDFRKLNHLAPKGLPQEQQALWDIGHYLKDDLLVKVDRASMHYSLESRVPLLDKELVEFALGLPYHLKVNPDYGKKYLMKKVLYELVPRAIFERPKRGFAIPVDKWLKGELNYLVQKYLSDDFVTFAGLVKPQAVQALLRDYLGGKTYLYNRVWVLLVLHWWFDEQNAA